jgi:hypothetical protein
VLDSEEQTLDDKPGSEGRREARKESAPETKLGEEGTKACSS